jgi:hypothetical protein
VKPQASASLAEQSRNAHIPLALARKRKAIDTRATARSMGPRQMLTRRLLISGLGGGAAVLVFPAAAQRAWITYRNERFGTTIEYPSDRFNPAEPPANGDGLRFIAADGAAFTVSAINNVLHQRLTAIETAVVKNRARGDRITHREHGPHWFALSGTRGNSIFYSRHLLSHRREIINDFEISYPAKLRGAYDPVVTRMAKSFRAGVGIDTGPP